MSPVGRAEISIRPSAEKDTPWAAVGPVPGLVRTLSVATSRSSRPLLSPDAKSDPSGEKARQKTDPGWIRSPGRSRHRWPATSQSLTQPSVHPEARVRPSGANASAQTERRWPSRVALTLRDPRSQSRIAGPPPHAARVAPSLVKARRLMDPEPARSLVRSWPVATSQRVTVDSESPAARVAPSGERARDQTSPAESFPSCCSAPRPTSQMTTGPASPPVASLRPSGANATA
jgi:hypothetical protein